MNQTSITKAPLPKTSQGNDPNDNRRDPTYFDGINAEETTSNPTKTLADLAPLDVEWMLGTEPNARKYLLFDKDGEGLIVAGTGAGIAAPGGSGKSTVALGLAYALAIGGKWLEQYQANHPTKVYFHTAEESADEIHHRLSSLHRNYCRFLPGYRVAEIEQLLIENLRLFTLLGVEVDLTLQTNSGFLKGKTAYDAVKIANEGAGEEDSIMIFDPLRKLTAGNEDGAAFTAVINTCDWIRENTLGTCTTFLIHHSSQSAQKNSDDTQSAFRGATDLVDGLRWTMVIQKLSVEQAKDLGILNIDRAKYRCYSFPKSNYSVESYGMHLEYVNGTYEHVVLSSIGAQSIEEKKERAKPVLCKVLRDLEELDEPVSLNMILQSCKAKPQGDEIGSLIPVGKNKDSLGILLSEAKKEGLVSSSQTAFPRNKKLGEAWKLTDAGRALLESDQ